MKLVLSTEDIGVRYNAREMQKRAHEPGLVSSCELSLDEGRSYQKVRGIPLNGGNLYVAESTLARVDELFTGQEGVIVTQETLKTEEEVEAWRSVLRRKAAMITDGGKSLYRCSTTPSSMRADAAWGKRARNVDKSRRDLEDDALTYLSKTDAARMSCLIAGFERKETGFAGIDAALEEVARLLSRV